MDCLFCKIINNEIPSNTIYEDDIVKVFLDINPTTNGNSLIVPKKHYINIFDIDNDTMMHIYNIVRKLYPIYQEKLGCVGITLCNNNEYGQEIKHFHMHFIPRYTTDKIKHTSDKKNLKSINEISKLLGYHHE